MSRIGSAGIFVFLAILWGLSFPAIEIGLEYIPPLLFAAARYDVAAVVMLAYVFVRIDDWWPRGRNNVVAIVGGGIFLVAGNGLLFIGQQTVPSGVAAILTSLIPIATAVWALLLLGERLSTIGAIGVAIGFLGVGLILQFDPNDLLAGDTVGRLIIVVQVFSVSLGAVIVQRAQPTIDSVSLTGWSMLLGAIILHGISYGIGELPTATVLAPSAIGAILYLGIFSTAIAFFIYFTILEEHGAFEAALVTYLTPIVATVVGVFVLGESMNALTVLGFGLVALGFALLKRRVIADIVGMHAGPGPS